MTGFENNRVVRDLGSIYPIMQAPMSWIARGQLVCAVSAAGAFGMLETSSRDLDAVRREYDLIRERTDAPFGINLAIKMLKNHEEDEDRILGWALDGRVKFVTTSAGDPRRYVERIKDAGVKVYHAVPSLEGALKAEDAGVDGLVVEGGESGGIRNIDPVHSFVLIQAVRARTDLPIVAAGGIGTGRGMAAAFALGAEGIAMGTRFVASAESPVHHNYKQAIVDAGPGGSILVPSGGRAASRVLRTELSETYVREGAKVALAKGAIEHLYIGGRLDQAMGSSGETVGLIDAVKPVKDIVEETVAGFWAEIDRLAALRG